jgi:hypothetical protein
MRSLLRQLARTQHALSEAYLDSSIRVWDWLNTTIADSIVACIDPLIGQLALLYRLAQMRSVIVSFGPWGGIYAHGVYAYRVCLGFAAITWLPLDVDAVLVDVGSGAPRHAGLSILLSQSDRQISGYTRYTFRAWLRGYAVALLPADIDDILAPHASAGK